MRNIAERGVTEKVLNLFGARRGMLFNERPLPVHPKEPGSVIRLVDGEPVLEQMLWRLHHLRSALRNEQAANRKSCPSVQHLPKTELVCFLHRAAVTNWAGS